MNETDDQDRRPVVGIIMGSDSDWVIMKKTVAVLNQLDITFDVTVSSAHRTPKRTADYARSAHKKGMKVIIAGAGGAAHLAGAVAALTPLPVIGVPIDSSSLQGLDALLSTVQMPAGVPVATVAIGAAGAKNAAILAAQILATSDEKIHGRLARFKKNLAAQVIKKADALGEKLSAAKEPTDDDAEPQDPSGESSIS